MNARQLKKYLAEPHEFCPECDGPMPPHTAGLGVRRKYCSDKCQETNHQYYRPKDEEPADAGDYQAKEYLRCETCRAIMWDEIDHLGRLFFVHPPRKCVAPKPRFIAVIDPIDHTDSAHATEVVWTDVPPEHAGMSHEELLKAAAAIWRSEGYYGCQVHGMTDDVRWYPDPESKTNYHIRCRRCSNSHDHHRGPVLGTITTDGSPPWLQ